MNISEEYVKERITQLSNWAMTNEVITQYIDMSDCYYKSKSVRLSKLDGVTTPELIANIIVKVFTAVLQDRNQSYQCLAGRCHGIIPLDQYMDRIRTISEIIAIMHMTGLICITSQLEDRHTVSSSWDIANIPSEEAHPILFEPSKVSEGNRYPSGTSAILGHSMNHHKGNIVLSHLNRLNQVKLYLDQEFIESYEEAPKKMPKDSKAYVAWLSFSLESAMKYKLIGNKPFFLDHGVDSRGRTYDMGYHVKYQGASFKKAIVQITPEILKDNIVFGYTPQEYLEIDIANCYGLDKLQFKDRLDWVRDNQDKLDEYEDADNYFGYAAAVRAYRKTQSGYPTGHMVEFDACASGIAILSVLTGCSVGASATGIIGNTRMDAYRVATDMINAKLHTDTKYSRTPVKMALMGHYYNSKKLPKEAFGADTPELFAFYEVAAELAPGADRALHIINKAWNPEAYEYNWDLPDGFQVKCKVKALVESKVEIDELNHLSFNYQYKENIPLEKGLFLPANLTHSVDGYVVREMCERCSYNRKLLLALSSVLVYEECLDINPDYYMPEEVLWRKHGMMSLDHANTIEPDNISFYSFEFRAALVSLIDLTLSKPSFTLLTIHDAFKAHANYIGYVRQTYVDILSEIADSNILSAILSDLYQRPIAVAKLSTNLSEAIKASTYCLS